MTSEELSEEEEGSSESGSEESSDSESSSSSSSSEDSLPSREAIEIDEEEGSEQGTKISKQHKKEKAKLSRLIAEDSDLEDSDSATGPKGGVLATAHEIVAPTVTLPSITEIGPDEPMELIGEVLNVVDSVVVVKSYDHGMQKVLDTESLLVFEDRKVLGLVNTFNADFEVAIDTSFLGIRNIWTTHSALLLGPVSCCFTSTAYPIRLQSINSNQDLPQPRS